mmetsp:Transcript_34706/g.83992  ORF Transcript_34706/g.83992 Transcript_34706/m.83992 type:complete len:254 (-) Transcript_34706:242-1003(-)
MENTRLLLTGLLALAAFLTIAETSRTGATLGASLQVSNPVALSRCVTPFTRSLQRSTSANAGLFLKKFQVVGVNHDVALEGKNVNFNLGTTGPATLQVPEGVEVRVPRKNEILIASQTKDKVLEFAQQVQDLKEDSGKEGVRRVGKGVRVVDTLDPVHEKKLKLVGVGYRAAVKGNTIVLNIGYSHPVTLPILEGVKIECPSNTEITISGKSSWAVGQMAYNIREWRKPEPYKGKGIKYEGERILMKEGKRKK